MTTYGPFPRIIFSLKNYATGNSTTTPLGGKDERVGIDCNARVRYQDKLQPETYEDQKYWGGLSITWLLGHSKVEGVGRGMCSLPHRARRKFCWYIIYMETILYKDY